MAKEIFGNNFSSTFDNNVSRLFSVGDISITKNLDVRKVTNKRINFYNCENDLLDNTTLNSLPNLNPCKLSNYVTYGSAVELFNKSLKDIINKFPASLLVTNTVNGNEGNSIQSYYYSEKGNFSIFNVIVDFINNPFKINYLKNSNEIGLRNLSDSYLDYCVFYEGLEYSILEFVPADDNESFTFKLKVSGDPFGECKPIENFYIKPCERVFEKFYKNLTPFQTNILNTKSSPKYKLCIEDIDKSDLGNIYRKREYMFPMLDDFNIDVFSSSYSGYFGSLLALANKYDEQGDSNILLEHLVPSIIWNTEIIDTCNGERDINGEKMKILLSAYACQFDELYTYIKGIQFNNILNYNNYDSVPDFALNQLSKKLGWKNINVNNNEYWRHILLNTSWMMSKKGTSQGIEYMFDILGIPKELVRIDYENYITEPLDVEYVKKFLANYDSDYNFTDLYIDDDGYPDFKGEAVDINKLKCIIPDFESINVNQTINTFQSENLISGGTFICTDCSGTCTQSLSYYNDNNNEMLCFDITNNIIDDPVIIELTDACGCDYIETAEEINKISFSPIPLYTGQCETIILNPYYDCLDNGTAILYVNIIGGTAPYTYYGGNNNQIVNHNDTLNLYVVDTNGCSSETYVLPVKCPTPIINCDTLEVIYEYNCCSQDVIDEITDCDSITITFVGNANSTKVDGTGFITITDGSITNTGTDSVNLNPLNKTVDPMNNVTTYSINGTILNSNCLYDFGYTVSVISGTVGATFGPFTIDLPNGEFQGEIGDDIVCESLLKVYATGGTGIYTFEDTLNNSIVEIGQTYVVTVKDTNDCISSKEFTVVCEEPIIDGEEPCNKVCLDKTYDIIIGDALVLPYRLMSVSIPSGYNTIYEKISDTYYIDNFNNFIGIGLSIIELPIQNGYEFVINHYDNITQCVYEKELNVNLSGLGGNFNEIGQILSKRFTNNDCRCNEFIGLTSRLNLTVIECTIDNNNDLNYKYELKHYYDIPSDCIINNIEIEIIECNCSELNNIYNINSTQDLILSGNIISGMNSNETIKVKVTYGLNCNDNNYSSFTVHTLNLTENNSSEIPFQLYCI